MASENMVSTVTTLIIEGRCDDGFETIYAALKERRKQLNAVKKFSFTVGQTVRFVPTARPAYLRGLGAIVTQVGATLKVRIENSYAAGRYKGVEVRCPASLIEAV